MTNFEEKGHDLKQQGQMKRAEALLLQRFSADEFEQLKNAAFARAHQSTAPNNEAYSFGLRMAVFMSNDEKPFQDILDALEGLLLRLSEEQQAQVNRLWAVIEPIGNGQFRLITDYRDGSPIYEFEADRLNTILEKAIEEYVNGDEQA